MFVCKGGAVFGKSFKSSKCKTSLRLAMSRIKLLRNKRDMQLQTMKRDLALLLQSGQDPSARIRVEHILREQNIMAAYDLIELFCESIVARLQIIESQRQCPVDLREALSSLIFAASRCADIPELLDIRKLFGAKYGKEFLAAAAELRPNCGVNRTIIEKLSVRTPSGEVKLKLMKEIAKEHNIDWDPAESEAELLKLPEKLLEGPTKFGSATHISAGSDKDSSHSVSGHKREPHTPNTMPSQGPQVSSLYATEATSSVANIYQQSNMNSSTGRTSVQPVDSRQESFDKRHMHPLSSAKHNPYRIGTDNFSEGPNSSDLDGIKRNLSGKTAVSSGRFNENVSLESSRGCNMYFKDIDSAAKAAAASAKRAITAAQAAAHLAQQDKLAQQANGSSDDSSSSDEEEINLSYSGMNRKPSLHQAQSFRGYDLPERTQVESHARNKNFYRNGSEHISRQNRAADLDNGYEYEIQASGQDSFRQNGNKANYDSNSTSIMQNYGSMKRSEKHCFGGYRGDSTRQDFDEEHPSPSTMTEVVYSNTLSQVFDDSDGTNSESDKEIGTQHFVSKIKNKPQSQSCPPIQPPARPPPGILFSKHSNTQSMPSSEESMTSRANSSKSTSSHVHPKLPDYDDLAVRFEALKYNRQ